LFISDDLLRESGRISLTGSAGSSDSLREERKEKIRTELSGEEEGGRDERTARPESGQDAGHTTIPFSLTQSTAGQNV